MPRVRKDAVVRYNEILDATQRLLYSKGYERLTIQDVMDEAGISRGGFFHHFASKQSLIDALVARMAGEFKVTFEAIVADPHLSATQKFRTFFTSGASWKAERIADILPMVQMWFNDENLAIRRRRLVAESQLMIPMFAAIIRQGIEEGMFHTPYPDEAAGVIATLLMDQSEKAGALLLQPAPEDVQLARFSALFTFYVDTFERILGAPHGSLRLEGSGLFDAWATPSVVVLADTDAAAARELVQITESA